MQTEEQQAFEKLSAEDRKRFAAYAKAREDLRAAQKDLQRAEREAERLKETIGELAKVYAKTKEEFLSLTVNFEP